MCDDSCRHFRHLDRKSVQADPDNASNTPADQGFKHPAKGSYITNGRKLIRVELPPSHSSRRHGNYTQKPHAPPRSQALRNDTGGFMATSTDVTQTPTPKKHTATPRRNVWTHRQEQPADTSTCHKARTCRRPTRSSQLSAAPLPTPDGVMPYRPAVGCRTGQAPSVPLPAYGATDRRRVTADRIFCRSGRIFRTAGRISHQCGRTE